MDIIVREMQEYLRNIARYDSDIPLVVPDGIYGSETTESVRAFQNKYGIEESGNVDFATWEKLVEENSNALFFFSQPNQIAPITNTDLPLKKGKESEFNYNLNLMLSRLASFYRNFEPLSVTSEFTENTERQVLIFQKVIAKELTGEVDKETWNKLAEIYVLI